MEQNSLLDLLQKENARLKRNIDEYLEEKLELQGKFVDLCHEKTLLEKDYKDLVRLNRIYLVVVIGLLLLLWGFRLFPVQFFSILTGQVCLCC